MGLVNGHVMEGVQFDEMGRRVAYWLFSYHPGGVLILNPRGGIISQPVPADQIMHVYRVLRPGQVRGVPYQQCSKESAFVAQPSIVLVLVSLMAIFTAPSIGSLKGTSIRSRPCS
jgi:hypothetical protein